MPALSTFIDWPHQIKVVMKILGIDPRKGINPAVRLREAKQYGHKGAFPEDTFLGILAARDVSSGLLETTNEEFQIIIGTRQQGLLQVLKQMRSQGDGDLLNSRSSHVTVLSEARCVEVHAPLSIGGLELPHSLFEPSRDGRSGTPS